MKNKMFALLAAILMTVSFAGNAMAVAFGHGHFIRVVYDSVGSKEYATDLGDWAAVSAAAATGNVPVGGGVDAITLAGTGAASLGDLYIAYYLEDPTPGANQVAIAGDANGLTSGARKFNGISNGLFLASGWYLLNMAPGTNSALLPDKTYPNTFYNRGGNAVIGAGDYAGWVTAATNPDGVLSLAALSTIGYVDQTIYYWSGANLQTPGTRMAGTKAFTVRTMADGSTIINPPVAADTVPPVLTVESPAIGLVTNYATLTVTGTAIDTGSGIKSVTVNGQAAGVAAGGFFSFPVTLVAGANTITVVAADNAGNSTPPLIRSVTLDSVPPVLTVTDPVDKLETNTAALTVTGIATDMGSGIKTVTVNDQTVIVGADGAFSTDVTLVAGNNTITVVAMDKAGNSATVTRLVTLNQTPMVLKVSTLADGSFTNNATLNISGTATDTVNGIKSVTVNAQAVTIDANGAFSHAVTLVNGANSITVVATNNAGATKTDGPRTITYDQNAPVVTITTPDDNSFSKVSPITVSGAIINETAGVTVAVNGGTPQSAVITGKAFTASVILTPGLNHIDIVGTEPAGNPGSAKRTVTYDPNAPNLAITDPPQDLTTSQSSYTIKGTVSDALTAVTLVLAVDGQTYTPAVTDGSFSQLINFTTEKTYNIVITATDQAGNVATAQRNIIYSVSGVTKPGDVNYDGVINVFDALLTLQYAVGLITHTPEINAKYLATADVAPLDALGKPKSDGVVNVFDALAILRKAVNLDTW